MRTCFIEVGGSPMTKRMAKYLMGSFHFLTKFSLQTPCQMSAHREFMSLLETIQERDLRLIDLYHSSHSHPQLDV